MKKTIKLWNENVPNFKLPNIEKIKELFYFLEMNRPLTVITGIYKIFNTN
jgi:hypothetical protein